MERHGLAVLRANDPQLAPHIEKCFPGDVVPPFAATSPFSLSSLSLFECLVKCICEAGVTIHLGSISFSGVRALCSEKGAPQLLPRSIVAVDENVLKIAGKFSLRKAQAILSIARVFGSPDSSLLYSDDAIQSLSDAEAFDRLTQFPNIGPWSANVILMSKFNRLDICPCGDAVLQRGIAKYLGIDRKKVKAADVRRVASKWSPFRTLGCRVMWRLARLPGEPEAKNLPPTTPQSLTSSSLRDLILSVQCDSGSGSMSESRITIHEHTRGSGNACDESSIDSVDRQLHTNMESPTLRANSSSAVCTPGRKRKRTEP